MFNRNNGIVIGFCNDSFSMSWRYHCVHILKKPPTHYFKPQRGDFIIRLNRQYDDIVVFPLIRKNHTFKGNYLFKQKDIKGRWVTYEPQGPVDLVGENLNVVKKPKKSQ